MNFDQDTKSTLATVAMVAAFAFGINGIVATDEGTNYMSWSLGLFVIAVLFWIWIRRDHLAQQHDEAVKAAEDAAQRAEELAKVAADKASSRLDDTTVPAQPVAEPVETVEDTPADEEPADADVAEEPAVDESPEPTEPDDLSKIEGIGPVYQQILKDAGVATFEAISQKSTDELEQIISDAGKRRPASIVTWVEQAELAAKGDWDALQKLQDSLDGGRRPS